MSKTPRSDALIDSLCPFLESTLTVALEEHGKMLERENWQLREMLSTCLEVLRELDIYPELRTRIYRELAK